MIYYNPSKQFLRAFIRAIRVFISSLFSKRFLLMIIVILFILLLHLNVNAESVENQNYIYRTAISTNYDDETNTTHYTGIIYTSKGKIDVDVYVPDSMNLQSYFLTYDTNNDVFMIFAKNNGNSFSDFYINRMYGDGWLLYPSFNKKSKSVSNLDTFKYFPDRDNKWAVDLDNYSGECPWWSLNPSDIVFQYNCSVHYAYQSNSEQIDYLNMINYKLFKIPSLSLVDTGFKYNYNDFIGVKSPIDDSYANYFTRKYQLTHLYMSVYDLNAKAYMTNLTDILNTVTVETEGTDSVTNRDILYSVLTFNEYFNYMNVVNGDYLIFLRPVLQQTDVFTTLGNFTTNVIYPDLSYWRYQYYQNTGTGSLVPSDSEGNPLEPLPDEPEEPGSQDIVNSIDNINNNLFNTEANEITFDDFGVSSPTIEGAPDLTNIFDLIYNSFMSIYEDNIYRIQFKLPSGNTTYNYDIPVDALSSKIPTEFITLIGVFWWVVLGGAVIRFIVKIVHQVVTYSNGNVDGSSGGFLSELTMTPTEFVLFNILH